MKRENGRIFSSTFKVNNQSSSSSTSSSMNDGGDGKNCVCGALSAKHRALDNILSENKIQSYSMFNESTVYSFKFEIQVVSIRK